MDVDVARRIKRERYGLNISMYGGIFFVIVEFVMSIFTASQAILMDAVYDAAELIMIIASLRIMPLLYKPTTEKHPFGYSQAESIFLIIKGSMLTAVTVGLVLNNIQLIMNGGSSVEYIDVVGFQFLAVAVSIAVIIVLRRIYRQTLSPLVKIEVDGWTIDCIASAGLGLAFLVPVLVDMPFIEVISPYLDPVMAIVLSVYILPVPVKTVAEGLRDLFLFAPEDDIVHDIKNMCEELLNQYSIHSTGYDIVRTGRKMWISIYFVTPTGIVSIADIKSLQKKLENVLEEKYVDIYVELVPDWEGEKA